MSNYIRKKILLVIAGDFYVNEKTRLKTNRGLKEIIDQFPEIGIMADVDSLLIATNKEEELTPALWVPTHQAVMDHLDDYDGFVVVVPLEAMLESSLAAAFVLQTASKPVLFTGSPTKILLAPPLDLEINLLGYRELGVRSNLVGAIHTVLTMPNEVCVFYGNRVMRAVQTARSHQATMRMYEPWQSDLVGRSGLGLIRTSDHSWQKYLKSPTSFNAFSSEVASLRMMPSQWERLAFSVVTADLKAMIYDISPVRQLPQGLMRFIADRPSLVHVLYSLRAVNSIQLNVPQQANVFAVTKMTPEVAQMKLSWLLAQMKDPADLPRLQDLMQRSLVGEIDPNPTIPR
ncbi:MAG: asparaginase domain-containing protein [Patescibacteria group bacterium]